jgi:hypothetical protein
MVNICKDKIILIGEKGLKKLVNNSLKLISRKISKRRPFFLTVCGTGAHIKLDYILKF